MKRFHIIPLISIALFFLFAGVGMAATTPPPPFFAREIPLATTTAKESLDALAMNANNEYLALWQVDAGNGNIDIWARRAALRPDFHWLGDAFAVANSDRPEFAAAAAYDPIKDEFLVVYEYDYSNDDHDVRAQRVAGSANAPANLLGPSLPVAVTTGFERVPNVSFLAATGQYLVVYEMDGDVWGRRVARRGEGDQGGDFLGDEFPIAAETDREETSPAVAAAESEGYFMVAYNYAFSPADDDVRGQRVRGQKQNAEELLGEHFILADSADRENAPAIAYSRTANAFIILWQVAIPFNYDVRGVWVDAGNFSDKPIVGETFDIATDVLAMEAAPAVDVDAASGEVIAALSYAEMWGAWSRPAQVWLNADPRAAQRIIRPLQVLSERPFLTQKPRVGLIPGPNRFLMGYTARWGTSNTADQDAYLLMTSRSGLSLPLILL